MTKYREKLEYRSRVSTQEVVNSVHVVDPIAPEAVARELESFSVTTDSVVATLDIVHDDSHRFITIYWGDSDTGERIDLRFSHLQQTPLAGGSNLPENTLRLQHVYEVPEKPHKGRNLLVLAIVEDDEGRKTASTAQRITVIPRYKFVLYPVMVEFNSHLDTGWESEIEFEAHMIASHEGETLLEKIWKADLKTGPSSTGGFPPGTEIPGFPIVHKLEGSQLSHEIALNEESLDLRFVLEEHDGVVKDIAESIWDFLKDVADGIDFDTSVTVTGDGPFHPMKYTGPKTFRHSYKLDDGSVTVVLNTEMNLLVPLDRPETPKAKQ